MSRVLILCLSLVTLSGCATLTYPLPKCDGYSKRPLNRSMWDWEAGKAQGTEQQSCCRAAAWSPWRSPNSRQIAARPPLSPGSMMPAPICLRAGNPMVTTDSLKNYFEKARRFDQDRMIPFERSNRIAWSIAIVSSIVAGVSVFAVWG